MGRAGQKSRLVLLCCATLLLVSTSAVSGFLDENVREWGRLAGRLKRHRVKENVNHHLGRFDVEVDEQKPAEGIWEKALSFFKGAFGNGTPNSAEKSVPTEGKRERVGRRHSFDRHRGTRPSHRGGIRNLNRNHPERNAAADISSVEDVTPASDFQSKIAGIVTTVQQDYHEENKLEPSVGSTCTGSLELEVISLVKSVEVALREHLCNGDVASTEEQNFCNRFNGHRTISTLEVLSRTDVNPVDVAWLKMSSTPICSSVNPHSDFLESLKMMEEIVREFNVLEVLNVEQELKVEHPHSGRHRQQHGVVRRHWWHRMLSKYRHMKHQHVEDVSHEREERHRLQHNSKEDEGERGPLHHERSGYEKHSLHHEPKEEGKLRAHGHKNASHEREGRHRLQHDYRDDGEQGPLHHERSGHEKHSLHHEPKEEGKLRAHGHKNASHEREGRHRLQHESSDEGERGSLHHERSGHEKHSLHHELKEEGKLRAHGHKNASHEREKRQRLQHESQDEGERGSLHHERSGHEKRWSHYKPKEEGELRAHSHKNASHEREKRHRLQDGSKDEDESGPVHHDRSGREKRWSHHEHIEEGKLRAHGHQDNEHEKHWWQRMSGMFHDLKHRRHRGFERAHGQDCVTRTAKHFARGIKEHVVTTCKSSTDQNVITACKFADQHHFLVKTWLAVKMPLWRTAAMVCEHPINSSSGSFHHRVPHAPNFGTSHVQRVWHPLHMEDSDVTSDGSQLDTSKPSAREHFHRKFNKTQHLRGHVIRIPTGDSADGFSTETLADLQKLQDRLDELVRDRRVSILHLSEPGQETTVMVVTPLDHDVFKRGRAHFRISANPDQAMPLSEGRRHFRISARPRARKDSHKETSTDVLPFEGVSDETESAGMDDMDVEIQGKAAIHTAENLASM